ncbi:MAG: hypothetical protein GXO72_01725 [Caldiserica bacterium]|nr:hypothetical protein [Caldisericota bacterium]
MKGIGYAIVVALVAGFVGGLVAGFILPRGGAPAGEELTARVEALEAKIGEFSGYGSRIKGVEAKVGEFEGKLSQLEGKLSHIEDRLGGLEQKVAGVGTGGGPGLKVGYVDADSLFIKVFIPQVQAERAVMEEKKRAISELQARRMRGEIGDDEFKLQYYPLQVELLLAQYKVDMSMLDKMIASPGFANLKSDLERLREQASPAVDEINKLLDEAKLGVVDEQAFMAKYQALQNAFQQLDQLLTQIAAQKIVEVTQAVAQEKGYDLVLRRKDVLVFRNAETVDDLSPLVEQRLWKLFATSS